VERCAPAEQVRPGPGNGGITKTGAGAALSSADVASASGASAHPTAHRTHRFVRNWEDLAARPNRLISEILSPVTDHNPRVG
jgi:hypothetical protein